MESLESRTAIVNVNNKLKILRQTLDTTYKKKRERERDEVDS